MTRLDSIDDFRIIEAIARSGSLSEAARDQNISLTALSKRLKRVESSLNIRLVNRTTRRLSLTAEGEQFAEAARAVILAVEDAEELNVSGTLRGVVRVTATAAFAKRHIAPRLPRFAALHPGIVVQVITSDRILDLVADKIDVAFRQAPLGDGRLITRTIAPDALLLVASPDYLASRGNPSSPSQLVDHATLPVGDPITRNWTLYRGLERVEAAITPAASSIDGEVIHAVALAGGGIAMKASWDVIEDIRAGRLVRVLPDWWGTPRQLQTIYPMRAHQPRRVRALVDFMEAELRSARHEAADLNLFP